MLRAALLGAVLLLSSTGGCRQSQEDTSAPDRAKQDGADRQEQAAAEIDRLRALPYAGYVDVEEGSEADGVVTYDPERSHPGYNLYIVHARCRAELIDAEGRVLRSWQHQPGQSWANGELLPNGDFLVVGADVSDLPSPAIADDKLFILRFNWNGELLWKKMLTAHHDVELTPREQLLTLTFRRRLIPKVDPRIPVKDDQLTLLSHDGEVLETLSLYDALTARPAVFPLARVGPNDWGGELWIDLFHANSIEWMHHKHLEGRHPIYGAGNVLVCFRHQNRVAIVDWDNKEVLWAWGARELSGPHDAHVLDSGNILIFDNGMDRHWSRVIEVDPLSRQIVWQYRARNPRDFFTMSKGANQRLPNGNTLITNSDNGRAFEVTPDGRIVWEFLCPHKNEAGQRATIVRTTRYERAYVERIMKQVEGAREIDRLRALPYAGYADIEPDEEEDGVVVYDAARSCPGYTLYTVHRQCLAELIDAEGQVIRSWRHQPSKVWSYGELLPNGDFLVVGADQSDLSRAKIADEARYILRFNWDGQLIWKRRLSAHHDITRTARGQLLTLTLDRRRVPAVHPDVPLRDEQLTLLAQDGAVVQTVSLYDLLSRRSETFPLARVGPSTTGGEPWIDLFHANSVEWIHQEHLVGQHPLYDPGNVLICFRHQDRVAVVNWDNKELVWAWGEKELSGPHDAHVLASGNILIFDNGIRRGWSRVIELDPLSERIVWQYQAPIRTDFYTLSKGSNQRLPNGNTLIANSDNGQVFEVTPDGEIVWEFRCRHRNKKGQRATIVFAERYDPAQIERIRTRFERSGQQGTDPGRPRPGMGAPAVEAGGLTRAPSICAAAVRPPP